MWRFASALACITTRGTVGGRSIAVASVWSRPLSVLTCPPSSLRCPDVPSLAPSFHRPNTRAFASHGRHKFAANGSKRFKKLVRPIHPNVAKKSERLQHKMKRLMVRRKREAERAASTVSQRFRLQEQPDSIIPVSAPSASASASELSSSALSSTIAAASASAGSVAAAPPSPPSAADIRPDQLRLGVTSWMVEGLNPSIRQMLDFSNASNAEIVRQRKSNWAVKFGNSPTNTGDTSAQSTRYSDARVCVCVCVCVCV
jgi:hypothetical protein